MGHLPDLWGLASSYLAGRTAFAVPQMTSLLAAANPFADWRVFNRYEAAGTVPESTARRHRAHALVVVGVVENAHLSGVVL
jgi:hypothetical protein